MPRNSIGGFIFGVFGLAWAAFGLVLAAWAATTALDTAKGFDLAAWAVGHSPFALPWQPVEAANRAINNLPAFAIAAGVALLLGWTNLRSARIAFRPWNHSQDGKGELQLSSRDDARVGRPLEGTILLHDPPAPGDEFDVVLSGGKPGHASAYRMQQKVRARQGAHGVNLPFRFDVPATAAPSGPGSSWRLEFARAGKAAFGRSAFAVRLAPAPAHEVRGAAPLEAPPASARAQSHAEHVARLADAFGLKMSAAQRERLHEKLSGPGAAANAPRLEMLRQLTPQHVKYIKYALVAFFVLFFLMPFVLSVLTLVLGALFA